MHLHHKNCTWTFLEKNQNNYINEENVSETDFLDSTLWQKNTFLSERLIIDQSKSTPLQSSHLELSSNWFKSKTENWEFQIYPAIRKNLKMSMEKHWRMMKIQKTQRIEAERLLVSACNIAKIWKWILEYRSLRLWRSTSRKQ